VRAVCHIDYKAMSEQASDLRNMKLVKRERRVYVYSFGLFLLNFFAFQTPKYSIIDLLVVILLYNHNMTNILKIPISP
jgi:hypothetical protein